jgi:hypothetical protein
MKPDAGVSRFLLEKKEGVPGTPSLVCAAVDAANFKAFQLRKCERDHREGGVNSTMWASQVGDYSDQ